LERDEALAQAIKFCMGRFYISADGYDILAAATIVFLIPGAALCRRRRAGRVVVSFVSSEIAALT
jgi:hypothetical protein